MRINEPLLYTPMWLNLINLMLDETHHTPIITNKLCNFSNIKCKNHKANLWKLMSNSGYLL